MARALPERFVLAVTVGGVIGLGILRGPGEIAEVVTKPSLYLALWLLAGADKLTYAADRIGTNYQTTKPLHFSKTQTPVVGNIDNASPISNDDPG